MVLFGNDTVTLFNRHMDKTTEKETWIPTLLTNVNLVSEKKTTRTTRGLEDGSSATLFVDAYASEKDYLIPADYEKMSLEDRKGCYTFRPDKDFFVRGNLESEESQPEGFFEYILNHYDDVFRVTSVKPYDDVMPHVEVGGA